MNEVNLYIHIPFCKKKCFYCDFISYPNKDDYIEEYIDTVIKEYSNYKAEEYIIKTVYIGGGTPSYIDSKYIVKLLKEINIEKAEEITIEINPGTVTKEKLRDYKKAGINRLSIGLQATQDILLKEIGRIHTYNEFLNTYNIAREIGFKNINIDLMLALPKQHIEDIIQSVKKIIELNPEHISIYSLILEEGTKMYDMVNKQKCILPKEDEEREMYWTVKKILEKNGYNHYEISNFAKNGYHSKHNIDCWNQKEYIGIGVSAHSYLDNRRYSNLGNIEEYIKNYNDKEIHEIQDKISQEKEYMILGLRKLEGVYISEFELKFNENPIYLFRNELNKLVNLELIEIDLNNIRLTDKGLDLANIVWEEFI
ncbi:MAG: oxygen-independent coproporphyrinogen III oxidase [Clostridia bacterium]|nr:oxygen-independent coproporphyrinogen III oxidase [Clostridia bacterium]